MFVILLAFLLRFVGISYGLPYIYHQDEPILVNHALALGVSGPNPHFFVLPPMVLYVLFFIYGAAYAVGHLLGRFADPTAYATAFLSDPSHAYLMGRFFLGTLCGTATVWVLNRWGARFFSKRVGFFAGLFLALNFLHAQHSHYLYVDIPLTFAFTLLCGQMLRAAKKPCFRNFISVGVFLGAAASIKYTAAYFAPAMVLSFMLLFGKKALRWEYLQKILAAAAASVLTFFLIAPFTLLAWPEFYGQITRQAAAEVYVGWGHHLIYSMIGGSGVPFVLLAALGFVMLLRFHRRAAFVLLPLFLVYYLVNVRFGQHFPRYMLPLMPLLALGASWGWCWLEEKLRNRRFLRKALCAGLILSLALPTVYSDFLFLKKDTRTLCLEWVRKNIPASGVLVVDNRFFGPPVDQTSGQIREKYAGLGSGPTDTARRKRLDLTLKAREGKQTYRVYTLSDRPDETPRFLFLRPLAAADPDALSAIGAEYLILNYSDIHTGFHDLKRTMKNRLTLLASFSPYRDPAAKEAVDPHASTAAPHLKKDLFSRQRLGPYLEVYRIRS